MNAGKQMYRQGDVALTALATPPAVGVAVAKGRVVLALGETSGHAHVIEGAVAEFATEQGVRIVWIEAPTELRHVANGALTGEHDTVALPVGWYVVEHQVDLADDDVVRQVFD